MIVNNIEKQISTHRSYFVDNFTGEITRRILFFFHFLRSFFFLFCRPRLFFPLSDEGWIEQRRPLIVPSSSTLSLVRRAMILISHMSSHDVEHFLSTFFFLFIFRSQRFQTSLPSISIPLQFFVRFRLDFKKKLWLFLFFFLLMDLPYDEIVFRPLDFETGLAIDFRRSYRFLLLAFVGFFSFFFLLVCFFLNDFYWSSTAGLDVFPKIYTVRYYWLAVQGQVIGGSFLSTKYWISELATASARFPHRFHRFFAFFFAFFSLSVRVRVARNFRWRTKALPDFFFHVFFFVTRRQTQ